ncbi:MAG: JAB domain-containing protein [Proteobacteria bacterium]|nr:JAB domain-containing protein [Pseudomonadota bacterium]
MAEKPVRQRHVKKGENMRYAYSLKTERVKEKDFPYSGEQLTCTAELVKFVHRLKESDVEKMIVILLDAQNQLCGIYPTAGTVNQAVVYPREILKHTLLSGASALILVHNHPSGATRPSDADIRLTKTIQEATKLIDVQVHDHLIVGDDRFFSFREEGLM